MGTRTNSGSHRLHSSKGGKNTPQGASPGDVRRLSSLPIPISLPLYQLPIADFERSIQTFEIRTVSNTWPLRAVRAKGPRKLRGIP